MTKAADVIVTDGFTGNVALKTLEGGLKTLFNALLAAFASEPQYKQAADTLLPALLPLHAQMSPDTYGGAVLLGVDGICIISHGSSGETAMLERDQARRRDGRSGPGRRDLGGVRHGRVASPTMPAETHVEQGPLDRNGVFEIVRASLADILEIEPSTITEGQSFVDDLDADSLALIELVEALEDELGERSVGFRIEDEDLVDLKTVRDAVDYVYERVKGN